MNKRILWLALSSFMALSLLIAACAPAATPATPTPTTPTTPATQTTPTAPVREKPQQEAVPATQGNLVSVTLKKLDGTPMTKTVEKPQYGGTLNVRAITDPNWNLKTVAPALKRSLLAPDYLLVGDWARGTAGTGEVSWQIYEYISRDHFMGALAETWEMPDDHTVIYHIRKGVHWALDDREASRLLNGREMTADDVLFSFKWIFFNAPKSILASTFSGWQNAEFSAPDKYTVVVKAPTRQDMNALLGYLSDSTPILPPEVIQKYGNFNSWNQIVGTGAFMIKDYVPSSVTVWVKNPAFWGYDPVLGKDYPLPYVDSVRFLNIPDNSTAEAAFRTGKLDDRPASTYTKEQADTMLKTYPIARTKIINFGTTSNRIAMQLNDKNAPWQDIRVRQALMMAINQKELLDSYYRGAADIQAFPLPNAPELYALGWDIPMKNLPAETQKLFEYHPDEAKKLLAAAGYPNGFKVSMLIASNNAAFLDLAPIVKDYWSKIGVDMTLDVRDPVTVSGYASIRKDFPSMTPTSMWGTATQYVWYEPPPAGYNTENVNDPVINDLRSRMFDVVWDISKRTPIMEELYKYTISQVWYLSLPSPWNYILYQPWLKNYDAETSIGNFGQAWSYVWIDKGLKKKLGY